MKWTLGVVALLFAVAAVVWFLTGGEMRMLTQTLSGVRCLKDTEKAVYEILESGRPGRARVSVIDTMASSTVWSREIAHPTPDIVDPIHVERCAFYAPQSFNYDWKAGKALPNYSFEIWRFPYFSEDGNTVVTTSENTTGNSVDAKRYYSGTTFSVDPSETYVSLERSYLGQDDYALVIKNIKTGEDTLVLSLKDIITKHPSAAGSFDTGVWHERPDGVYLDSDTFDGSRIGAQIFIKRDTWDIEILPTPEDYLPGVERRSYSLSPFWAYTDVIMWAGGIQEVQDALLQEAINEGRPKNLILANLRTGEKTIVESVPIVWGHRFNLFWLDERTLEYTMPDGTRRTYTVH